MPTQVKAVDLLAPLGIEMEGPDDDEMITGAVIIMRSSRIEGGNPVAVAYSDGMDWVTQRGLLEAAIRMSNMHWEGRA